MHFSLTRTGLLLPSGQGVLSPTRPQWGCFLVGNLVLEVGVEPT